MNKHLTIFLCFVMVSAIVLIAVCSAEYFSMGRQVQFYQDQLTESRNTWEKIALDKEKLQKELKAKKNELKEAELSLSEATEKAKELKLEIESLKAEIDALKSGSD